MRESAFQADLRDAFGLPSGGPGLRGAADQAAGGNAGSDEGFSADAGALARLLAGQGFTTERRLYHLTGIGPAAALASQLLVESWTLHEALSQPYVLQIHVLSTDARLPVGELLGQFLVMHTLLADGSRSPRSGLVLATQTLECDGGLARFAVTLGPWSALSMHLFGSGVHQGVPATEIAERSWRRLAPRADWAWGADVAGLLARSPFHDEQAASPGRRLCSQWRESDHAFIQRLLAEEGIGYAFEEVGSAQAEHDGATHPAGAASPHRLRAFADSTTLPWDDTVQRDGAIRFHQAGAVQAQDAVHAWGCTQRFSAARTSVLAWHRKAKRALAATSATADAHQDHFAAPGAPRLEHYLVSSPASGGLATTEQAQRAATLLREAEECRLQLHIGRSTVRTLRAGRRIRLSGAPAHNGEHLVTAVAHAGFNNLPKDLARTIERRIGAARLPALPRPDASWSDEARAVLGARHADAGGAACGQPGAGPLQGAAGGLFDTPFGESFQLASDGRAISRRQPGCGLPEDVVAQAQRTGYANALCAIPASTPWRPQRWRSALPARALLSAAAVTSMHPARGSLAHAAPAQQPLHPKPEAPPVTTALVVGPQGEAVPQPGQEIHTDRLGRVRVRFHWQAGERADDTHTPWLRVAQRLAGPGMGWHFTPRIGQEVLVGFLCDDIDQPVVLGAVYNGQGEAGVPPTPGGKAAGEDRPRGRAAGDAGDPGSNRSAVDAGPSSPRTTAAHPDAHAPDASDDHRAAAQGNRIGTGAGGHAPAWHGAAARSHANAAAFTGIKTQEFAAAAQSSSTAPASHHPAAASGPGYNQLVFDDTPRQLRVQLATSQHATQLNLGHLIHQADNHRGSLRGQGWELRTDAWGAVRAAGGVLLTTYGLRPGENSPTSPEPAGDNTAGLALARQMTQQAQALSQAAATHQTVPLASHQGSTSAAASALSDRAAPLHALQQALAGEVHGASLYQATSDAPAWMQRAAAGAGASVAGAGAGAGAGPHAGASKPHTAAPVIAATARAGLIQAAAQDIVAAAQDTLHLATGGHSSQAIGGQGRTHTGQAIGVLAGAIQPGPDAAGIGLSFIAAQGDLTAQAQAGTMQLAARDTVRLQSAARHIDWSAAQRIVLGVAGGASLTIDASGITVQCPGKLTVQAGQKRFVGPHRVRVPVDPFTQHDFCLTCFLAAAASGGAVIPT